MISGRRNFLRNITLGNGALVTGLPLDQDVYDAALWSSISALSEKSVANRSRSMDVPDFTKGAWKTNQPVNLTLDGGCTLLKLEQCLKRGANN